ncbi:putative bifunctional diguanylate cyclase/phosphodiesterase, partial [Pantoea endophytica]
SIFIAIASSAVAMWLTFYLRIETENVIFYRMAAATIMGGAIAAMHYTGMGAAHFHQVVVPVQHGISIAGLSVWVTTTTLLILGGMLFVSMLDAQRKALKSNILLKEMNESLERCALYDSLTELPNRDFFDRKLKEAIQLAETTGKKFSLMYMDLDGFKLINDAWGHHVGDFLLKEVAKRFKSEMNDDLIVARLGGDEFVLFYNEGSLIKVKRLAEKLTGLIRMPFKYKEYMLRVSLSTGISVYPEHGKNAHELKFTADCAMYSVKEQGRDGWMIYDEKYHNSEHSQPVLLQELTHALDKGQLEVWYQPQVDALNGKIVAFEALLRWAHPRRGVMPPDTFMRLAEKTALILSIGRWVLDESCKKLNEWNSQNSSELKLSINLSELQFYNFQLIEDIKKALYKHNISPNWLTFEINSSAVLKDITRSSCILKKLNALQVNISLNDYGNCISDILHLQNIPVSELELNRDVVTWQ